MVHRPHERLSAAAPCGERAGLCGLSSGFVHSALLLAALLFIPRNVLAAEYFFRTDPPVAGAEVFVDERPVGTTDGAGKLFADGISPGVHAVRVEANGVVVANVELTFDADLNSVRVPVSAPDAAPAFEPPSEPGVETVDYIVDTNVPDAEVYIDGRLAARTGNPDASAWVPLALGRSYDLRVSKAGFLPAEQRITASDVGNKVRLTLAPAPAGAAAAPAGGPRRASGGIPTLVLVVGALVVVAAGVLAFVLLRQRHEEVQAGSAGAPREGERARTPISFDQYRVSATLGQGGVATIYRAVDSASGAPVALKILDSKWMGDPEMVQKFLSEAEAIKAIHRLDRRSRSSRSSAAAARGSASTGGRSWRSSSSKARPSRPSSTATAPFRSPRRSASDFRWPAPSTSSTGQASSTAT